MFQLDSNSKVKLSQCRLPLIDLITTATHESPFEFRVTCGLRTQAEQDALLARGASRVKSSKHQIGCAVDLVPWIGGMPRWDWPLYFQLADHIRNVAKSLDIGIVWGGSWNVNFTLTNHPPQVLQTMYIARCKKSKKKPFLDGPHFELCNFEIKKLGLEG